MTDEKGDKITEPNEPQATTPAETLLDTDTGAPQPADSEQSEAGDKLSSLMAAEEAAKAAAARSAEAAAPDLDAEALLAAEQALLHGERALAEARAGMAAPAAPAQSTPTPPSPAMTRRGRELALRLLLAVNVLAMIVVSALPEPATRQETGTTVTPADGGSEPANGAPPAARRFNEPWNRAMDAADRRDFRAAVEILEQYLVDAPRMPPSTKLSVLMALSHYAARDNDFKKAEEFQRRTEAIDQSHSLPEDLVAMAQAAAESGDQETLRRIWARFLLQQRQIPSWLYKHVAEAYLQLGDSYRRDADVAADRARRLELQEAATRLREESVQRAEKPR